MNISEYPFSKFIGIDISKDKIDVAELKGATGKTIGCMNTRLHSALSTRVKCVTLPNASATTRKRPPQ